MDNPISHLIKTLEQAKTTGEIDRAIDELAQIGETAIPDLLRSVKSPPHRKGLQKATMRILQKMGYPANRLAIPFVVGIASDINSPGWDIALTVLREIGEPTLPDILDALQYCSRDYDEYSLCIQGLCTLLEQMGSPTIDPLLPELLHLLEIGTDENLVDEYALWPIRRIGSPRADAAVPLLREIITGKRSDHIRRVAIEALQDFAPPVIQPLTPVLRGCLLDESEAIRAAAHKVLAALGETQ